MRDNVRLILVGDWGSGVPRARNVSKQIRQVLDEGLQEQREQHVVHLGDVYYAGWEREYRKHFLEPWPVAPDEDDRIGSWNLNGNHDMDSGGWAYYDVGLADRRFKRQENSSFFSLYNKNWQVLGVDTAWENFALKAPQAAWAEELLKEAPQKKALLMSHHQPFSVYETDGLDLLGKLRGVLSTGKVRGWFWGHEHRCMLYKAHLGIPFGRCVGHGGVPVYQWHNQSEPCPDPGQYEYCSFLRNGLEYWALMGFVILDFDGPKINVRYINEYGQEHKRETIS